MATKIVTKNSSTGGAVPSASDLVQGELAVNVADKRLFTEDNGGSIVELGTKPSTIDINAGTIDGTAIGASSASTGAFTTLTATGAFTSLGIDDNADATAITIDSSENVGIGNSSPSTRLTVGAGSGSEQILVDAGAGWADLKLHSDATNGGSIYFNDGADAGQIFYYHPENSMRFHTNATEKARLTSDGNLGIGTSAIMQDFGGGRTTLALKGTGTADYSTLQLGNYGTSSNGQIHGLINFYDGTTSVSRIQSVRASNTSDAHLAFYTAPSSGGITERMRIDSSGNVGIGTSSPSRQVEIYDDGTNGQAVLALTAQNTENSRIMFADPDDNNIGILDYSHADDSMRFTVNNSERMRLDASGNLLVGKTATAIGTAGHTFGNDGYVYHTRAGDIMFLNRTGSDGTHLVFYKDGASVGSIGTVSGDIRIGGLDDNHASIRFAASSKAVLPVKNSDGGLSDNTTDLGASNARFNDAFITNGVTTGSDGNYKQDIRDLTDAEQRVAMACKGLLKAWRWKDRVAEKGDDARIHFGIIAQDLQAAFEAEGLDAGDYAMFMSDTWTDEETDEEKTRMGVRYSELLAFIISAI